MFKYLKLFTDIINKFGKWEIVKRAILLVFISFTLVICSSLVYIAYNPSIIYDGYIEYIEHKHSQSFKYRMETTPIVQENLNNLVNESEAKRGFVIELHNGKYNSAGLSFNYGSLTYESLRCDAESIMEDYADFSLERFPIALIAYNKGMWSGTIEDLSKIDKRVALRLESNGVYYLYLKTIYGVNDVIGFIGLTYDQNDEINEDKVMTILNKYSSKISPLLDGEKAK